MFSIGRNRWAGPMREEPEEDGARKTHPTKKRNPERQQRQSAIIISGIHTTVNISSRSSQLITINILRRPSLSLSRILHKLYTSVPTLNMQMRRISIVCALFALKSIPTNRFAISFGYYRRAMFFSRPLGVITWPHVGAAFQRPTLRRSQFARAPSPHRWEVCSSECIRRNCIFRMGFCFNLFISFYKLLTQRGPLGLLSSICHAEHHSSPGPEN